MHLLKLGKLCKGSLDLTRWIANRVDRDFRWHAQKIDSCQDKMRASREKKEKGSASKIKKRKNKGEKDGSGGSASTKKSRTKSARGAKASAKLQYRNILYYCTP